MPKRNYVTAILLGAAAATPIDGGEISTHMLDLARGVGGQGVPVTLSRRYADGCWTEVANATTDANEQVRSLGDPKILDAGDYCLIFDTMRYPDAKVAPFFPEIISSSAPAIGLRTITCLSP